MFFLIKKFLVRGRSAAVQCEYQYYCFFPQCGCKEWCTDAFAKVFIDQANMDTVNRLLPNK